MILMLCAVFIVMMDYFLWKRESKWSYFMWGMLFAFGSLDAITALAHWIGYAWNAYQAIGLGGFVLIFGTLAVVMLLVFDRW